MRNAMKKTTRLLTLLLALCMILTLSACGKDPAAPVDPVDPAGPTSPEDPNGEGELTKEEFLAQRQKLDAEYSGNAAEEQGYHRLALYRRHHCQ